MMHNYIWENRSGEGVFGIALKFFFVVALPLFLVVVFFVSSLHYFLDVSCDSCGKQVNKEYNNCPYCGESLIKAKNKDKTSTVSVCPEDNESTSPNNVFCSSCGKQVEKEYNNCPYCGESLIKTKNEVKTSVVIIYPENDNNVSDCQKANR